MIGPIAALSSRAPNGADARDVLPDGLLNAVHPPGELTYTREGVALEAARAFCGTDVARLLSAAGTRRCGLPAVIQCDNGTEFTSTALDHWAYWNKVQLDFSRPGKQVDNCVCEAFNGSLRREYLSLHLFTSLDEAQGVLTCWQDDYNNTRPHKSLDTRSPVDFATWGEYLPRHLSCRS